MANKRMSIKDPDLAKVGMALERAAVKARQLGLDTNTPVYVFRDGKIVDIVAEYRGTQLPIKASTNGSKTQKQRLSQKTAHKKIGKRRTLRKPI